MKTLNSKLLARNVEKIAEYDLENNNVFGSSYYVYQNGDTVLKRHFGYADADGNIPIDDNTIFRMASMTKPITAVGMLILIDRGLISLSDPVYKFLPEFENICVISNGGVDQGITKTDVNIMHLLTHTSGLGTDKVVTLTDDDRRTVQNTLNCYIKAGLDFEPFSMQRYSPFAAFDALEAIAEEVTKQDFESFLQENIFIPCNMKDTTFCPTEEQWDRVAVMHNKNDGKSVIGNIRSGCVFGQFPCEHKLAGAGLVSTINDYSHFAQMLLNEGMINNKQILSYETFKLMTNAYVPTNIMPGNENWGLGVRVITDESYGLLPVGSFGWSGAYGTHFWIDPSNNAYAVFMKNSQFDGGSGNKSACRFEEAVHNSFKVTSKN